MIFQKRVFLICIMFSLLSITFVSAERPNIIIEIYSHSRLDDLEWNLSGHIIDINLDLNEFNITNMSNLCNATDCYEIGDLLLTASYNKTYADFVEANMSNKSTHWGELSFHNETQMEDSGGVLTILESWLDTVIAAFGYIKNLVGFTTDDLTEGTINLYDNQSWNESRGDVLYLTIAENASLRSTQNDTYDALINNASYFYYPTSVNLTTGTHTADLGGYASANAICDSNYTGSHLCTEFEISAWFTNQGGSGITGDAWVIAGSPKYAPASLPVNDCGGFTHGTAGTYLGNYWHFNTTEMGDGRCINCGTELPLCCASYD